MIPRVAAWVRKKASGMPNSIPFRVKINGKNLNDVHVRL